MNTGKTLFAQVMEFVPWTSFARIVQRYSGNSGVHTLSRAAEQFRAMGFARLTWRESLRDSEASLPANATELYEMGFRSPGRRSTLVDEKESRDWRICSCPMRRASARVLSPSALATVTFARSTHYCGIVRLRIQWSRICQSPGATENAFA